MSNFTKSLGTGLIVALAFGTASQAFAGATIINPAGTIAIGVNDVGHLNTTDGSVATNAGATGVSYNFGTVAAPDWRDATAPGCLCEGWGVSKGANDSAASGYANVSTDGGIVNLTQTAFSSTATTASVTAALTSLPGLSVKHDFTPATNASSVLYRVHVTIENTTGAEVTDLRYVRVMDWDVPPTEFAEYVTIKGTATTTFLETSHNNGFNTANPLNDFGARNPATLNVDFEDSGIDDHGAYFKFNFGSLADQSKYEFDIFYGAAGNERAALAAIGAESIELYSLGQSDGGQISGEPATFIFGFRGVGGTPIEPNPTVPEPGSLALVGLALAGLWRSRRNTR